MFVVKAKGKQKHLSKNENERKNRKKLSNL